MPILVRNTVMKRLTLLNPTRWAISVTDNDDVSRRLGDVLVKIVAGRLHALITRG